jgi:hypothetical protein
LRNDDDITYTIKAGPVGAPLSLEPGTPAEVCFEHAGAKRVRLTDEPYSGGFVLVDPEG